MLFICTTWYHSLSCSICNATPAFASPPSICFICLWQSGFRWASKSGLHITAITFISFSLSTVRGQQHSGPCPGEPANNLLITSCCSNNFTIWWGCIGYDSEAHCLGVAVYVVWLYLVCGIKYGCIGFFYHASTQHFRCLEKLIFKMYWLIYWIYHDVANCAANM